jgi:hypothetical protein
MSRAIYTRLLENTMREGSFLAGEQGDVDLLDHLDTVKHFAEGVAAQRLG